MYIIYKICCKDKTITDCYVGRTSNFEQRKERHKSNCNSNNRNHYKYNYKVYQFIREHNGFENWNFEVLETCDELTKSKELERKWYEILSPTLNIQCPNRTKKEIRDAYMLKELDKIREPIICECGGRIAYWHKNRHLKTKKHLAYLESIKQNN